MDCEQLAPLYEEYALGVLDDDARAELEAHLARACPKCTPGPPGPGGSSSQLSHAAPGRSERASGAAEARFWKRSDRSKNGIRSACYTVG